MRLFDVLGPVMIGPSSSHTAGAARIGYIASKLLGGTPASAEILLHGSFATTGKGHGTDKALVAGLLGMRPDDPHLADSLNIAPKKGLTVTFGTVDLREAHPNTALLHLTAPSGKSLTVRAASVGGGRICVNEIDGVSLSFSGETHTLIIHNNDAPGSIAAVTSLLAAAHINVASMQVFRSGRGERAVMVLECDQAIPEAVEHTLCETASILKVTCLNLED